MIMKDRSDWIPYMDPYEILTDVRKGEVGGVIIPEYTCQCLCRRKPHLSVKGQSRCRVVQWLSFSSAMRPETVVDMMHQQAVWNFVTFYIQIERADQIEWSDDEG